MCDSPVCIDPTPCTDLLSLLPAGSPFVDARAAFRVAEEQAAATDGQRARGGEAPS